MRLRTRRRSSGPDPMPRASSKRMIASMSIGKPRAGTSVAGVVGRRERPAHPPHLPEVRGDRAERTGDLPVLALLPEGLFEAAGGRSLLDDDLRIEIVIVGSGRGRKGLVEAPAVIDLLGRQRTG